MWHVTGRRVRPKYPLDAADSSGMGLPRTLFALVGIVLSVLSAHGASPPVTVTLQSSFTASDPLLEAL